ncbi:MAG: hypothetical protein Q9182_006531 [Xanthomendoza sp. 2 TL-2023]
MSEEEDDGDQLVTKPFKFVTVLENLMPVQKFFLAYRSLCPSAWCERWDDQRGI